MIKLTQLAQRFEDGLNSAVAQANIDDPKANYADTFKIWAEVGDVKLPERKTVNPNEITFYINGNLRTSTSANNANDLVMGINGLTLDLMLPLVPPRNYTDLADHSEDLAPKKDGQYAYVNGYVDIINKYFQKAQAFTIEDDTEEEYTVSFQAGTAVTGVVDMVPVLGRCLSVSVYIELYFIEGGINSKNVKITIDGYNVPYQTLKFGRSPLSEQNVYSDKLISKSTVTSTAFAIDMDIPATKKGASAVLIDYLFEGEPNVAHFVTINYGGLTTKTYFMTVNNIQTVMAGISVAGISLSLMEVADNAFNVPESYQVGRFYTSSNKIVKGSISYKIGTKLKSPYAIYVAGQTYYEEKVNTSGIVAAFRFDITPGMLHYDEKTKEYYVDNIVINQKTNPQVMYCSGWTEGATGADLACSFVITKPAEEAPNGKQ